MKNLFLKYKVAIIVVVLIVLFVLLSLLIEDNSKNIEMKSNLQEWLVDTKKDEYVVTVLAQTTCSHCIAFKPVMQKVLNENDFNVYWFEVNNFQQQDYQTLIGTYDLTEYEGTPYTFITKNGELVAYYSRGAMQEYTLIEFLRENKVIE